MANVLIKVPAALVTEVYTAPPKDDRPLRSYVTVKLPDGDLKFSVDGDGAAFRNLPDFKPVSIDGKFRAGVFYNAAAKRQMLDLHAEDVKVALL